MICANDNCPRPRRWIESAVHSFSGYGFYVAFHPECCPRFLDGSRCLADHPLMDVARVSPCEPGVECAVCPSLARAPATWTVCFIVQDEEELARYCDDCLPEEARAMLRIEPESGTVVIEEDE